MCGIAGIVDLKARPVEPRLLKGLCDAIAHRGPDDESYYFNHSVGLGQRRLSIIDLSGGKQPMSNRGCVAAGKAKHTLWITFNGEIYGYQSLRDDLVQRGHSFTNQSDTETILHAYEEKGVDCVKQLRGMFALALWDENERTLFLARDRVGKKPLFYAQVDGQFIFGSELQAMVQHPALSKEINRVALDDYLTYGYIPAPQTIFKNVQKLEPAHYLLLRVNENGQGIRDCRVAPYWELDYTPKAELGEAEAEEGLLRELTEAVRLRMIADVPLGALLSGGVDSSIVVALMSQLSSQPVKTFSIGFAEQEYNELPYARRVAERYHTDHHELIVRPNALEILPTLIRHYGEPYADSSAIPTYYVAKMTRQHVTVALNGDGGDESMAGYDRYMGSTWGQQYQKIPLALRRHLLEAAAARIPDSLPRSSQLRRAKRFVRVAGQSFEQRYLSWVTYFSPAEKQTLYTKAFCRELDGHDANQWLLQKFAAAEAQGLNTLDTTLTVDVQSYLPYDLLVKMDIATMANSLEGRSPFLDHKVMEYCARLPGKYKLRGTKSKYLLKKLGKKLLPPENLERRKMGFGVPVGQWMRAELRPLLEDALLSSRSQTRGYFQSGPLREMVQAHISGKTDYSFRLWALLCLELWHREFID